MNYGMSLLPLCCAMGACVCGGGGGGGGGAVCLQVLCSSWSPLSMSAPSVLVTAVHCSLKPPVDVYSVSADYGTSLISETTC